MLLRPVLLVALFSVIAPTLAGPSYQRPAGIADDKEPLIVAGYRALFTCSAHFIAGRPLDDIKEVEFADVRLPGYPDPAIDEQRQLVTAADPSGKIVRIAAYRDSMGCTILPPQWSMNDVPRLPYVSYAAPPDLTNQPFPAGDRVSLPASGLDPQFRSLAPAIERAFDGTYAAIPDGSTSRAVTTSVIIVKNGKMVAERYRPGFGIHSGYRTWSTAKSISAAVMGIAAGQGLLNLDDRAAIPEWDYPGDPRQAITYKHLLWMSSGLVSGGNNTFSVYFGGQDAESAITTTPLEAAPGARWKYANNDSMLLLRALRARLGDDLRYLRFAYDELLRPIGMYHTRMETDHLGHFVNSSQVYTTARDLTRFGLLLANDGVWNGKRLLPEGWVKFSTTAAPTKPPVAGEWGYAAQFWLLDQMPGVPAGTYTTAGNKGQYVTVVPGQDLVIVRTGVDPNGVRFQHDQLVADVVKALAKR